jgi:hypothetical protein
LGSAIFASALFFGSAIILTINPIISYCGITASIFVYASSLIMQFRKKF